MTKLRYLALCNPDLIPFGRLPTRIQMLLSQLPHDDVQMKQRNYGTWHKRVAQPGKPFSPEVAYRIHPTRRPAGIPDEIHERYMP